jgi:hypothetical protein
MFRNLGMFLSSGEGAEKPTLLGPLETANLDHCIQQSRCLRPLTWRRKHPVSETLRFLVVFKFQTMDKVH